MASKTIKYSEPVDYFPKATRDKYFGKAKTTKSKSTKSSKGKK